MADDDRGKPPSAGLLEPLDKSLTGVESNASSDNDQDEVMEDVDNDDTAADQDDENNDDGEDENENDNADDANDNAATLDGSQTETLREEDSKSKADGTTVDTKVEPRPGSSSSSTRLTASHFGRPVVRPEALSARLYDIVPTMAAPQATSVNCLSITPDLRYWFTGGSDGYIRKYSGPDTINGKTQLTVAQRHPFVDSVVKAGVLLSYLPNEEPPGPNSKATDEPKVSPVYSLAAHSRALWILSGLTSGAINLQSVRHDEGKRICSLSKHTSAVSVLTLVPDEKSVLSGSWDKNVFDWDLNTGVTRRSFEGSGGQISAIELRPACGSPFPAHANEVLPGSETFSTNNGVRSGLFSNGGPPAEPHDDIQPSPVHESLFGGSDGDAGSLFGDTDGGAFGMDGDDGGAPLDMSLQGDSLLDGDGNQHDVSMTDIGNGDALGADLITAPAVQPPPEIKTEQDPTPAGAATTAASGAVPNSVRPGSARDASFPQATSQIHPPVDLPPPTSPTVVFSSDPTKPQLDPGLADDNVFLSASFDGAIRVWDRRLQDPVSRITPSRGVPPWCMAACWSPDGNCIYAGRRNGTVEEFNIHKARRGWEAERTLKFPAGSGSVSAVRAMPNGRHLVCASYDILRLYDLRDSAAFKHSSVPFLIIPGPPRAGVISSLYIDPTARFMISAGGTRGWEGTSTEVIIGYEINVVED
jgi:transcriptional activator SPT8